MLASPTRRRREECASTEAHSPRLMPTINVHCRRFPRIVNVRTCFSVPNKVRLMGAVSHREFPYYPPPLFPFSSVTLSRANNRMTPQFTIGSRFLPRDDSRTPRLPRATAGLRIPSSRRRSRRNDAERSIRAKRLPSRRVASPTLGERLLLSTRPCASRTPAFVVVVIVSSRVMGRFQARRGGGPALEAALKGSLGKRRHVGAHLRSRCAASRDATVAGEQ